MLKGKRLIKGSKIGIVAPASGAPKEDIEKAKKKLEELGYEVEIGESCHSSWYKFSGSDRVRARDINRMFEDREIDGIMCLRGGYGSIRLLDLLDYKMIRKTPKVFIGYSDITSLHTVLNSRCDLITFHGPMATSNIMEDFDRFTSSSFHTSVVDENNGYMIDSPEDYKVINKGQAEGPIVGGNLAVLVSTLGTPYEIDTKGKILFIEDVGEVSYRIDRMLIQLLQGGKLTDASGIIIGNFTHCDKGDEKDFTVEEVFDDVFKGIKTPVIANIKSGHCKPMVTIPFGARSYFDTEKNIIEILENTVE